MTGNINRLKKCAIFLVVFSFSLAQNNVFLTNSKASAVDSTAILNVKAELAGLVAKFCASVLAVVAKDV